jgi:signal transduction histidine kinase
MSVLEQIIELLSQTPGNLVYHLVVLLAMQATLGIAAWQWRRDLRRRRDSRRDWRHTPADSFAQRLTLAAAGMILGRIAVMVAALYTSGSQVMVTAILPPLEHFADALIVILLIWALGPQLPRLPRLNQVILVIVLLFSGIMYLFLAQNWYGAVLNNAAVASYNLSSQAIIWSAFQLALLTPGLLLLLVVRRRDWLLRATILLIMAAAHGLRLINFPETAAVSTDIAYWTRLGNLLALPLVAALAYRHSLAELLQTQHYLRPSSEQLAHFLQLSRQVIKSLDLNHVLQDAVTMATEMTPANYAALAIINQDDNDRLRLVTSQPQADEQAQWGLSLSDWPALRLALQQKHHIQLTPIGLGARQLHELSRELSIPETSSLLIEPLHHQEQELGVLILADLSQTNGWQATDKALVPFIAGYIAQAIANSQQYEQARRAEAPFSATETAADEPVSGRLLALEKKNEAAQARIETLLARLSQTEAQLLTAQEKLNQRLGSDDESFELPYTAEQLGLLENENAALRESLREAEEAMAMVSASEGGLSTEWVMLALTRYSGELEEAQTRIQELEQRLADWEQVEAEKQLSHLVEELRTPLTSIAGYTDLLLSQTLGTLVPKQSNVLRRIEVNVEQTETLLSQMMHLLSAQAEPLRANSEPVNLQEMVETAVTTLVPSLRSKGVRLCLETGVSLAVVRANRNALHQITLHLLRFACHSSPNNGRITIQTRTSQLPADEVGENGPTDFLQLTVSETGEPLPFEERLRLFQTPQSKNGRHPDQLADLYQARSLIAAHGGRIWVESLPGAGNVLSALLPIGVEPPATE